MGYDDIECMKKKELEERIDILVELLSTVFFKELSKAYQDALLIKETATTKNNEWKDADKLVKLIEKFEAIKSYNRWK